MQDLTKMSDEDLVNTVFGEFFSCRVPLSTQVAWSSEILRRLSLARIDGKAVSCPSEASGWSARDEACLRGGGAD